MSRRGHRSGHSHSQHERSRPKNTPMVAEVVVNDGRARAFDMIRPDAKPCPVCLELVLKDDGSGIIQPRAVMPLPPFPARLRSDGRQCCRDCQATETAMAMIGVHPSFGPARLCVANERCESLVMPFGLAEHFGMCKEGLIRPASVDDLEGHIAWLKRNNLSDGC